MEHYKASKRAVADRVGENSGLDRGETQRKCFQQIKANIPARPTLQLALPAHPEPLPCLHRCWEGNTSHGDSFRQNPQPPSPCGLGDVAWALPPTGHPGVFYGATAHGGGFNTKYSCPHTACLLVASGCSHLHVSKPLFNKALHSMAAVCWHQIGFCKTATGILAGRSTDIGTESFFLCPLLLCKSLVGQDG